MKNRCRPSVEIDRRVRNQRGTTLAFTLFVLLALFTLTVASLLAARSERTVSSNYESGLQALLAAKAGVLHAQEVINERGAANLRRDVVEKWDTLFGAQTVAIDGYPRFSYLAEASNDDVDPANFMILTGVGHAPNKSERTVHARTTLDGVFSPGAIYLPRTSAATFIGDKFLVDGHDTNLDGTMNPDGDVPGIAARTRADASSVEASLSNKQVDNVTGAGGTPSVEMARGFTLEQLTNELLPAILAHPGVVTNPDVNGNVVIGTLAAPQVTHFTQPVNVTGNLSGVGILIADAGLTISGSSTFIGLIVVNGTTSITNAQGNTSIRGALWTSELRLSVGGSASLQYSSEALRLANAMFPGGVLPQRIRLVSWREP